MHDSNKLACFGGQGGHFPRLSLGPVLGPIVTHIWSSNWEWVVFCYPKSDLKENEEKKKNQEPMHNMVAAETSENRKEKKE